MECTLQQGTLQQDTMQEKRKGLRINFQRSSTYWIPLQYIIHQIVHILVITRQNISQDRKPA